jgi:hypothetical protein
MLMVFAIFGCFFAEENKNKVSACFYEIAFNSENPVTLFRKLVPAFR